MRILKILNSKDIGGVLIYEIQFITELKRRGVIVDAVIIGDDKQAKIYENLCDKTCKIPYLNAPYAGPVHRILFSIFRSYLFGFKYAMDIRKHLNRRFIYDAIIYCRPNYIHLAGFLSKMLNTKPLWHLPNPVNGSLSKKYYNFFCKHYNISSMGNSVYTKNTLGADCKHVVYMGYDEDRTQLSSLNFREQLGIKEGVPVYGVAARLNYDKAQDIVVEAFLNSQVPAKGGHLLVAGGPLDSEFSSKIQRLSGNLLGTQVHFLGEINNLPMFYSTVDVIINGRRNAEAFGISVAEALGAGKPVLAYYLGGPSEMVVNKENGWLIKSPTVEEFRLAFNESLEDKENWVIMGQKAKARSKKYSVAYNVDTLLDIINTSRVLV